MQRLAGTTICAIFVSLASVAVVRAGELGFAEEFALSTDRGETLKKLIPGTEDYFYYHCLHYLNIGENDKAAGLFKPWLERFNQTARLTEMQTRHALLNYEKNPQQSFDYFKNRLGLTFSHQRVVPGGPAPNLPTSLDPKLISRATLAANALNRWRQGTFIYEANALDWALSDKIDAGLRRQMLTRLVRPDVANLAKIVADDLNTKDSGGFGSFTIHRQLTLAQLDELSRLKPELLGQTNFVEAWLKRLQPGDDEDWRHDPVRTRAYLDRLLAFTRRLAPSFNGLKACVLHNRLVLGETLGVYDKALFVEYLGLPRAQSYMSKAMLENDAGRRQPADLNHDYSGWTMLPAVGSDEVLVRGYLKEFLAKADSPKEFEPFINDIYLKHLFAEVKIENGVGEPETWAADLPPAVFQQFKDRIDIDFAHTNKTLFAVDEPVKVEMFIKNVPSLMVKVFEVNTRNFYRTQRREIDTAINLDGLVPNWEQSFTYTETPFRRVGRSFEFPQLSKAGVYVIDFIGNGKSSRALIRKGRLRSLAGMGSAGQKLTIIDESNKLVPGATVWLGGQEFKANDKGVVTVPFSTQPGLKPVVITSPTDEFSSLDTLQHQAEQYELAAGIHVDRESLLTQQLASILIRPSLQVNGLPVSIKVLTDVKLVVTATDQDGIATSTLTEDFKLFEDRESVHEFRVPSRLAALTVSLTAKVKSLSTGKDVDLTVVRSFGLGGIDKTDKIEDLHLARFGKDYVIEVLGRTGEPRADRPVQLTIKHRDLVEPVLAVVKSDAHGRIMLGSLPEIATVTALSAEQVAHTWALPHDQHTYRRTMHAVAGEPLALPYLGSASRPERGELALFEMRGPAIQSDRFDALAIGGGMIEIAGLKAGDYELWLKETGERILIRVVDGPIQAGYVLGGQRHVQLPALKPVQIAAVTSDAEMVTIKLRDFSKFTRLHVFGDRYLPAFSGFADLGAVRDVELEGRFPAIAESMYLSGRNIGDELRYVLDRRGQKRFPGNMLDRPALLLNPWVVRSTETGEQLAEKGEEYQRMLRMRGGDAMAPPVARPADQNTPLAAKPGWASGGDFANLDFLAESSAAVLNLEPDKDGFVKVPRKLLGGHAMISIIAVDPLNTTARTITLPEQKAEFAIDLRLRNGLDPRSHFTQQKQVSLLAPNQQFVLADAAASRFEVYDTLGKVYGLYSTLSKDTKLAEFSFIANWPKLKLDEKKSFYSKFACHELNFFLAKKDPEFFKTIVKPYLANKKDKTFLDHWLLEDNLQVYLQPWQHARLNVVERILLAQRLTGESSKTARHLNDLKRLLAANNDREQLLYETALKRGEMGRLLTRNRGFNYVVAGTSLERSASGPATGASGPMAAPGARTPVAAEPVPALGILADEAKAGDFERKRLAGMQLGKQLARSHEAETLFLDDERKGGKDFKDGLARLYRRLDLTQELAENNYYQLPIQQQLAALIGVSDFWTDYAVYDGNSPFLSRNLADASHNFTEMMFALAVLDLPFTADKQEMKFEAGKMTFTCATPALVFHEEVKPAADMAGKVQILVSQNFYRAGDRFKDENGERLDKFVTAEFVIHTVYGCQVVVTNPTPSKQRLSVLLQVPVGSIAVANGQPTKTVQLDLEPYHTQLVDYQFYFPLPGRFAHFPVQVAKGENLVAAAAPFTFNVVEKPSKLDTESWEYVSQNGSADEVVAMMNRENIQALDLEKIAFRMKDKEFFETVLALLKDRHAFNATLWSYALYHRSAAAAKEYLTQMDQFANECGPIDSALLAVNPVVRHQYEHLGYKPLINARAHALGQRRQIVNNRFFEQYTRFVKLLTYRDKLTDAEQLELCYYLLLQDRVDEAASAFARVHPEKVGTRMQYDYCAAYLDMFSDEPKKVRAIIAPYLNHPVERWRNAFTAIASQLDEFDGKAGKIADRDDQAQQQAQLAAKEASFEFGVAKKTINLTWKNIETVQINYYLMDVELLFSRNPFVQQSAGQFSLIRPNESKEYKLPNFQNKLAIPMPEGLADKNVLVEITANGKTRSAPVLANAMHATLNENYGQVQITDAANDKPLAKVYVKTYVRLADGTVKFHKDGYTDHRGKFDYASVSTPERTAITKFGILVLSDTQGALIREVDPPQQ